MQDTCAYHADFSKEKLLWMDMSPEGRFAYSDEEMYCNNKGFIMTGGQLKFLCAVLNSTLLTWMMSNTARTTGMGLLQWEKFAVERLPVPIVAVKRQRQLVEHVDRILTAKSKDLEADTRKEEAEIDRLVFRLYELTDEEIPGSVLEFRPLICEFWQQVSPRRRPIGPKCALLQRQFLKP